VQELERELGGPLFRRHWRNLELSSIGIELLRHARIVSDSLTRLHTASRPSTAPDGPLRMGSIEPIAHQRVARVVAKVVRVTPDTAVNLTVGGTTLLGELLAAGTIDLAVTTTLRRATLEFTPWYDEPLAIAIPHGHPFSKRRTITVEDLLDQPLLLSEPTCEYRAAITRTFRNARVQPHVRAEIGSQRALTAAARAGLGIAIGPLTGFEEDDDLFIRRLAGLSVTIGIVTARKRPLPALADEVRSRLLASPPTAR
jgi:DNA-binding transcriptional LysR family regulator